MHGLRLSLSLLLTLLPIACTGSDGDDETAGNTTNQTTNQTTTPTATNPTSTSPTTSVTTDPETTDASSTTADASGTATTTTTTTDPTTTTNPTSTTTTTTNTTTSSTSSTTNPGGLPDGSACAVDSECQSDSCFVVPLLGGVCGECKVDADCPDGGCTIPNPFADGDGGAKCNMGEAGGGCQSDAVCDDPQNSHCGLVLDATPIIEVMTCGACKTNADCKNPGAPHCSPTIDFGGFTGQNFCVPGGSVPNDTSCNHNEQGGVPIGNAACASGKCGVAVLMGVVQVGVCGECLSDFDCNGGTCQDAEVDPNTFELQGAQCI